MPKILANRKWPNSCMIISIASASISCAAFIRNVSKSVSFYCNVKLYVINNIFYTLTQFVEIQCFSSLFATSSAILLASVLVATRVSRSGVLL